jgi:hypothetical protein
LLKSVSKVNLRRVVDLNLAVVAVPGHQCLPIRLIISGRHFNVCVEQFAKLLEKLA